MARASSKHKSSRRPTFHIGNVVLASRINLPGIDPFTELVVAGVHKEAGTVDLNTVGDGRRFDNVDARRLTWIREGISL